MQAFTKDEFVNAIQNAPDDFTKIDFNKFTFTHREKLAIGGMQYLQNKLDETIITIADAIVTFNSETDFQRVIELYTLCVLMLHQNMEITKEQKDAVINGLVKTLNSFIDKMSK